MSRILLAACLLGLAASPVNAGFVVLSTGFEPADGVQTVTPGTASNVGVGTPLGGGFAVSNNEVDIFGPNLAPGSGGRGQVVDLQGGGSAGPGSITVTFNTIGTVLYTVDFLAGVNNLSQSGSRTRSATATVTSGSFSQTSLIFRTSSSTDPNFSAGSFSFIGTGGLTTLTFTGNAVVGSPSFAGVLLDDISVTAATPAPAGLLVLLGAAPLLGLARRRLFC